MERYVVVYYYDLPGEDENTRASEYRAGPLTHEEAKALARELEDDPCAYGIEIVNARFTSVHSRSRPR